jgi:hypothetical protein
VSAEPGSPTFTIDEARAMLPTVRSIGDQIVSVRAQLTIATRDEPPAPLADAKALEARLSDLLDQLGRLGVQVKGWAPLLVDFPAAVTTDHGEREVLLCWLEGERELAWFHDPAHGIAGRRPISDLPR